MTKQTIVSILKNNRKDFAVHQIHAEFSRLQAQHKREMVEAKNVIKNLLIAMPHPICLSVHHNKQDYHSALEDCPVEKRILQKIEEAQKFLIDS